MWWTKAGVPPAMHQVEEHFMHHNLRLWCRYHTRCSRLHLLHMQLMVDHKPQLPCGLQCSRSAAGVWTPPAAQLVVDHLFHRWSTTCVTTGLPPVVTLKTTPQLSCGAELHLSLETPQLKVVVMPQDVYCCCAAKHKKVKYNQTKVWLFK